MVFAPAVLSCAKVAAFLRDSVLDSSVRNHVELESAWDRF